VISLASRKKVRDQFKSQAKAIRVLAGMQVDPEGMKKLTGRQPEAAKAAPVLFWIGCNLPRTAHLVLTIEDIFERLGLALSILGGMDNCCGIVHFREGDNDAGGKIVQHTLGNMVQRNPRLVLVWCPTCHLQFSDILKGFIKADFQFQHLTRFLVDHLETLSSHWTRRIDKRVAIHEHTGVDGVTENVRALVSAIPGIIVVEVPQLSSYGYMCSRLATVPEARETVHKQLLEAARRAEVDVVVTPYHSCQRDLCVAEKGYPFEVKNFVTLMGEALGIEYQDKYKSFRLLGDEAAIVEAARPLINANSLDEAEVRRVIKKELL